MKMLTEKGTQVYLSSGIIHHLMESQPHQSRKFLHYQICQEFDCYGSIDSLPASQPHPMYLKVILKPSPELFYGVMLPPYRDDLTSPKLPAESHNTLDYRAILKEQQDHLAKGWAFRCFSGYWYTLAAPRIILQLYCLLVQSKLLTFPIYTEDIVAFGVNQYLVKSCFCEHIHQFLRTIGTIESDGKLGQINPLLFEELQHLMEHFPEYLWLSCVGSTLLSHRSYAQGDYPAINLDCYSDDVLTTHHLLVFATEPTVSKTYDSTQPVYNRVINAEGDPCSGEGSWTHSKSLPDHLDCFLATSNEKHFSEQVDAPGFDGSIYLVLIYTQNLSHLVGSEYLENMTNSQHQQYLNGFVLILSELKEKKLLKRLQNSDNILLHLSLLVGVLAFSYAQPIRRLSFSFIVNGFLVILWTS